MKAKLLALLVSSALVSNTWPAHSNNMSTMFIYNDGVFTLIPSPSGTVNEGQGINSSGQVTGYGSLNGLGGFVYSNGVYNYLSDPSAAPNETLAHGINDFGQVVGEDYTCCGVANGPYGFLYTGNSYTPINDPLAFTNTVYGTPIAEGTSPMGINDSGQIVGYYRNAPGETFGFLYSGGTYTTLSYPGAIYTAAYDINNKGQVLGAYVVPDVGTGLFLFYEGVYTSINTPFAIGLYDYRAYGLNDLGDIVGTTGSDGFIYNILTRNSQIIDYNDGPNYYPYFTSLADITDSGEIVGNAAGNLVPETPTWAMMLIGFAGLGFAGYRASRKTAAFA